MTMLVLVTISLVSGVRLSSSSPSLTPSFCCKGGASSSPRFLFSVLPPCVHVASAFSAMFRVSLMQTGACHLLRNPPATMLSIFRSSASSASALCSTHGCLSADSGVETGAAIFDELWARALRQSGESMMESLRRLRNEVRSESRDPDNAPFPLLLSAASFLPLQQDSLLVLLPPLFVVVLLPPSSLRFAAALTAASPDSGDDVGCVSLYTGGGRAPSFIPRRLFGLFRSPLSLTDEARLGRLLRDISWLFRPLFRADPP